MDGTNDGHPRLRGEEAMSPAKAGTVGGRRGVIQNLAYMAKAPGE